MVLSPVVISGDDDDIVAFSVGLTLLVIIMELELDVGGDDDRDVMGG